MARQSKTTNRNANRKPNTCGRKSQGKTQWNEKDDSRTQKKYEEITTNDINWWNRSALYPLATSIQYNKLAGYIYDQSDFLYTTVNASTGVGGDEKAWPGVARIDYYPTIGVAKDAQSPVNLAFTSLFAELVAHTNSSNVGFQQADLALVSIATSSVISLIAEAERALGLLNVYFRDNGYFPQFVLEALNIDFNDLKSNRADYMLRLQSLVQNFNAISVPSYIITFERAMQLGRNIYMDDDVVDAQIYVYNSLGYYLYDDGTGTCHFEKKYEDGTNMSMDILLGHIESAITALRGSESYGNILGAIRRAFPDTALIRLDIPSTAMFITPVHDRNVTWQLNNAMFTNEVVNGLDITQNPVQNCLIAEPYVILTGPEGSTEGYWNAKYNSQSGLQRQLILNSFDNEIGNEFAMEATRSMFAYSPIGLVKQGTTSNVKIASCGTEILAFMSVFTLYRDGTKQLKLLKIDVPNYFTFGLGQDYDFHAFITQVSKFNNHPRIWLANYNSASSTFTQSGFLGDLATFTTITPEQLGYMHLAALQSAYLITVGGERGNI